jgi:hypothetical protein
MAKVYGNDYQKTVLYSTVIPYSEDGYYEFQFGGILTFNEPFRREFHRLERILLHHFSADHFLKWKSLYLHKWVSEFFLPVIKHLSTQKIIAIVPHFSKKFNIEPPAHLHYNDKEYFTGRYQQFEEKVKGLVDICYSEDQTNHNSIEKQIEEIKISFEDLKSVVVLQYDEEERYWPEILLKYGRVSCLSCYFIRFFVSYFFLLFFCTLLRMNGMQLFNV